MLIIAVKAINFKMEEAEIHDMKSVASVFHMTVTDVIKEAVREYVDKMCYNASTILFEDR